MFGTAPIQLQGAVAASGTGSVPLLVLSCLVLQAWGRPPSFRALASPHAAHASGRTLQLPSPTPPHPTPPPEPRSSGTFLAKGQDSIVARIEARVSAATHLPVSHAETLQILRCGSGHWAACLLGVTSLAGGVSVAGGVCDYAAGSSCVAALCASAPACPTPLAPASPRSSAQLRAGARIQTSLGHHRCAAGWAVYGYRPSRQFLRQGAKA